MTSLHLYIVTVTVISERRFIKPLCSDLIVEFGITSGAVYNTVQVQCGAVFHFPFVGL